MVRPLPVLALLVAFGAGSYWFVTRPAPAPDMGGLTGDAAKGEQIFWAGGCASCHAAEGATGEAKLVLAGGRAFPSDFGTFYAPNISPDPEAGIGDWSMSDLARAMQAGVSPDGRHYYPAFPYTSYQNADLQDLADLHAFMKTLPADSTANRPHDVGFPFNIRRNLGGWKWLFTTEGWQVDGDLSDIEVRGRYLAEALGHCGECHTDRNGLGALDVDRWMAGAPNPTGEGRIPNITPAALDWSEADIAEYLNSGFTPDYDSAGGHMADVVENTAKLPPEDRAAIAAYLKRLAPVTNE
ncbi:MAG: cytochrome c [Pseudomonadota bacterium]